ncbi:MAG: translation initiation factor IF-2, partial [Nitrospirota bacterium]
MRVYELAKKLGMESRLLITELVRLGIDVTSHSNTLDDETAGRIMEAIQGGDAPAGSLKSLKVKVGDSGKVVGQTKKGELRGSSSRPKEKGGRVTSAVITEEPKKPEKKHILIKRKKLVEDEISPEAPMSEGEATLGGEVQELSPLQEATTTPSELSSPSPTAPIPPPDLSHPSTLSEQKEGGADMATVAPEPSPVPGFPEVAQVGPAPESEEARRGGKTEKKEAVLNESTDSIGEKVKKPKKGIRARDEDLFAARYEDAARWQDLRPLPTLRREERTRHTVPTSVTDITKPRKKVIKLDPGISVKEFAEKLGQRPAEVIRKLMDVGIVLTLNQPMNLDAGMLIAEGMGLNVEVSTEKEGEALLEEVLEIKGEEQLIPRAPVVTIMGHVDHGKTTLLDAIRETRVTDQEAGGITQHIGAYSVKAGDKRVTFLDTPGHEAFTAMRARGAQVTDIVVLVVSADDGVMPQTVEAIHHAQAANVPIIVAINKIDKPGANPDRVKQGLSEHNLISEAWGGQTIFVEVSAKEKQGLDHLLEMILLQAEVMELKGDIEGPARGVVLEAKLERGRGPVATVLVQAGHLKVGAVFVVGSVSGRVRALNSDTGAKLKEAGPSLPVEIIGLLGVPIAGDQFVVVKDDRMAREVADARHQKQRTADLTAAGARRTLDE